MTATHRISDAKHIISGGDTCDCCGRTDLLKTIPVVALADGGLSWFGSGCAARACGLKTSSQARTARARIVQDIEERARLEQAEARKVEDAKWAAHIAGLPKVIRDWTGQVDRFRTLEANGGYQAVQADYLSKTGFGI